MVCGHVCAQCANVLTASADTLDAKFLRITTRVEGTPSGLDVPANRAVTTLNCGIVFSAYLRRDDRWRDLRHRLQLVG